MPPPNSIALSRRQKQNGDRLVEDMRAAPFVCGTSALGNLYRELEPADKLAICAAWFQHLPRPVVIDSAGRYGAGMALEEIGRCLRELAVPPDDVLISNKLGWRRKPLVGKEPTFEPGLWKGMVHDAELAISYEGILECWRQGCEALGEEYRPRLVSIHDPDEFLAGAVSEDDRRRRMDSILDAYRALGELKRRGEFSMIGVGAKDWRVIREIDAAVPLDWVMFATLLTVYRHPPELLADIEEMSARGTVLINAGVFHSGYLVGGELFDYRPVDGQGSDEQRLLTWRKRFTEICGQHDVTPAAASIQFALSPPGVSTVALNCDSADRVEENLAAVRAEVPRRFWEQLKQEELISTSYPYLG